MRVDRPRGEREARERITVDIRRVVPDITSDRLDESRAFYVGILGFEVAMDLGWVMTLASPTNPAAQITLMRQDATAPMQPQLSVEVADVDAVYAAAMQRDAQIVYPLTEERWGVRRFFVVDPNGVVVNVVSHHGSSAPPTTSQP
jgi:catechol 2,3-dioxygenase-like lactoylglutathione lyase family enzyme